MKVLKVMLVDDEFMILEGMKKLFDWHAYGCEIICTASDGIEAVNQADVYYPDIVVMDINLPIMTGLEAIHIIRQKHPDTAFVVVSGYDEFEYCREALRLRIVDYMLKPLDFSAFGTVIERIKLELVREKQLKLEEKSKVETSDSSKLIFRLIAYINAHIGEDISLQVLADEFHLNPTYISQMFKNETGIKYYAYLTQLRINKAKTWLATTDANVTEVAGNVGFGDYRTFSKTFKTLTGVSPSQFQKNAREVHESHV